uniref:Alpha-glucosidase n=1 Tax=Acrobeloides nanus TaxID=290746 RepID=A0A914E9R1_9BILA
MGLENDGKAHGVFAFNSAPQEVTTGPGPHLTYRTIGGQLEFYFFPGPTPEQVVQQYQQICKFGYLSTSEVETVVNRTVSNGIPFDVAWVDINYANRSKDFTLNKTSFGDLPAYADYLHSQNMKLIVIVDPGIAVDYEVFERGLQQGASFIEWASPELVPNDVNGKYPLTNNTNIMLGAVWPLVHVAFPDFLDPTGNTTKWWINEFTAFHQMLPVDGIWIDMNEPSYCPFCATLSNFGINPHLKGLSCPMTGNWSEYDNPPYLTAAVYLYPDPNVSF